MENQPQRKHSCGSPPALYRKPVAKESSIPTLQLVASHVWPARSTKAKRLHLPPSTQSIETEGIYFRYARAELAPAKAWGGHLRRKGKSLQPIARSLTPP